MRYDATFPRLLPLFHAAHRWNALGSRCASLMSDRPIPLRCLVSCNLTVSSSTLSKQPACISFPYVQRSVPIMAFKFSKTLCFIFLIANANASCTCDPISPKVICHGPVSIQDMFQLSCRNFVFSITLNGDSNLRDQCPLDLVPFFPNLKTISAMDSESCGCVKLPPQATCFYPKSTEQTTCQVKMTESYGAIAGLSIFGIVSFVLFLLTIFGLVPSRPNRRCYRQPSNGATGSSNSVATVEEGELTLFSIQCLLGLSSIPPFFA